MKKRRLIVYGGVLFLGLAVAVIARAYLDRLSVHDYSSRRSREPVSVLVLSDQEFGEYLQDAFEFRVRVKDGEPDVVFQAGTCLLAKRHAQGREATARDRLVTAAVLKLWPQRWMQDFAMPHLEAVKREVHGSDTLPSGEALTEEFVNALVSQPEFRVRFRALLADVAAGMDQPIAWEGEES